VRDYCDRVQRRNNREAAKTQRQHNNTEGKRKGGDQ
jgi:hypothetical protein